MEAASLGRGGLGTYAQSLGEAVRARSRAFWIVAGLTAVAALLRFLTLGAQSYHHDEVVTAGRILRGSFGQAMDAVGFSESAPPLYYALAWIWTQVTGTGEFGLRSLSALAGVATVPVVYLVGVELRGRRAGLMAAALAAVNPMLLWYSQEARAYSLLALLCAVSLLYCLRALRYGRPRDLTIWGIASGLALATHYFAVFPIVAEVLLLLRRRGRATLHGLWIVAVACLLLAPLAIHQMSIGHAEWIGTFSLGHRVWETAATFVTGETGDIIGQPERPALAFVPLALCIGAFVLLAARADRDERRAAALPLTVAAFALGIPVAMALLSSSKDYVLARNVLPALIPLLLVVAIAVTLPSARRLGAVLAAGLLAYSLGFCIWASYSPQLQRPDWSAVASRLGEPQQPRATVTWTLGEAPLRHYLSTGAYQVRPAEKLKWLVHEVNFVSQGSVPRPSRHLLGPGFRESAHEEAGPLFIRRYRLPGPGLAPLRLRQLRHARLDFRTTGVLVDGVGPG
ncbi:MAG: glycosyltransferase family 39 protein [Solirubrobacterales bacterium]